MNKILITYDLRAQGRNYAGLIDAIKKYPKACKVCESTWLIHTTASCWEVGNFLNQYVDGNDRLFVVGFTGKAVWKNVIDGDSKVNGVLQ